MTMEGLGARKYTVQAWDLTDPTLMAFWNDSPRRTNRESHANNPRASMTHLYRVTRLRSFVVPALHPYI